MPTSSPARNSLAAALFASSGAALAQADAVTVTATRIERPNLEIPASVDRVHAEDIRFARPQINLSESLGRVPGIVVQNRQNYAQDLQVTSRGFGARSTFGIRGIRLITDGIPASFPDGQGQVSHFDLGSAERIEVLRGPFSVMYGNASGGVINIVTESGGRDPGAGGELWVGRYGMSRGAFRVGALQGSADLTVSGSRFSTNGYRVHSSARRDQLNTKVALAVSPESSLTLVANYFDSPETEDPGGLTRADMNADPRQVVAAISAFNSRKSVRQSQAGVSFAHRMSDWRLNASVHGGHRDLRQYLAFAGGAPPATTSGGIVDLDRGYGGMSLRLNRDATLLGRALALTVGGEYERMAERRKGYVNRNGSVGALRRDEDDVVSSGALYAQAEWRFAERWIGLGGLRTNQVAFHSSDYFVAIGNPDDSGKKTYVATTPAVGLLYRLSPAASVYANYGRGFETPTFAELAHRNAGSGAGLNFGLAAARSRHIEAGLKAVVAGRVRLNGTLFDIGTRSEIVVDAAAGGRTTFKNAGRTRRTGVEFSASAALPLGLETTIAWTRIDAKFRDTFTSGLPAVTVAAGNYLPGVPRSTLHAELRWRHVPSGFGAAFEVQHKARVWVNDRNSEAADAYTIANLGAGFTQHSGNWRFSEYLRVDNLTGRRYAGSVIVNDANGRFYEPAPGRNALLGVQARLGF